MANATERNSKCCTVWCELSLVVFYVFQTQRYHLQGTRAALNSIHTVLCPVSLVWHLNFLSSHIACMPLTIDRKQCQTCCGLWIIYTNVCQLYLAQEIIHSTHIAAMAQWEPASHSNESPSAWNKNMELGMCVFLWELHIYCMEGVRSSFIWQLAVTIKVVHTMWPSLLVKCMSPWWCLPWTTTLQSNQSTSVWCSWWWSTPLTN